MRTCKECRKEKPLEDYSQQPKCKGGRHPRCKTCLNRESRERYAKKGKSIPPSRLLYNNAYTRAKTKSLPLTITQEWVQTKLDQNYCEVTGLPLGRSNTPFAPSLERVIPSQGYTPENTKLVVWIYNRAKGSGTHEDVLRLAEALIGDSND